MAQIITFGTLGARAAIRDVGRVMDIPLSEVDRVAKLIPNIPGKPVTISEALEEIPEFKQLYESEDYLKELIDTASRDGRRGAQRRHPRRRRGDHRQAAGGVRAAAPPNRRRS